MHVSRHEPHDERRSLRRNLSLILGKWIRSGVASSSSLWTVVHSILAVLVLVVLFCSYAQRASQTDTIGAL